MEYESSILKNIIIGRETIKHKIKKDDPHCTRTILWQARHLTFLAGPRNDFCNTDKAISPQCGQFSLGINVL